MDIDRRHFIASLGGIAAVQLMSSEAKADAIETYLSEQMNKAQGEGAAPGKFPTAAEIEAQVDTRNYRAGAGRLFVSEKGNVKRLEPMPAAPTFLDFFKYRVLTVSNHCLQSANRAMKTGQSEEIVFACLLHDTVQELIRADHGYWGAEMYAPYVSEKVTFAIRYHQALRFYEDASVGYHYPDLYRKLFGEDYVPEPYIKADYEMVKKHKWYMEPRMVTVNDLYAFEPGVVVTMDPFVDIVHRHFKQPKDGLGYDGSPVAHMWRAMWRPDSPL